jgi:hypothetical protein
MIEYKVIQIPAEELPEIEDFQTWINSQGMDDWIFCHLYPNRVAIFKRYGDFVYVPPGDTFNTMIDINGNYVVDSNSNNIITSLF